MISGLVSFCLRRRWLMVSIFFGIFIFGVYSASQLSIDAYPDISDTTVQVITTYPGHAAEEVEKQITIPLERELNGVPNLKIMRSKSTFGLSIIQMVFQEGTEDYFARQRVLERVNNVTLPPGIQAGLDPLTSANGEIYRYTLQSRLRSPRELRDINNWVVFPAFKQVPGVVDVDPFGGENYQYQVIVDPDKLAKYGLFLPNVISAISSNNVNAGGGKMNRGEQAFVVRGLGAITDMKDIGNIVITQKSGTPIFVRDIGEVVQGALPRQGILGFNNNDDAVSGIVDMLRGSNPSRVLIGVHEKVKELNSKILPRDVKIVPYLDRTELVNTTLERVTRTLLEGITLVVLVLVFFLGNVRGSLIVALTIPFALFFAFTMMNLTKIPANLLSLGAIDFGIIVDGAIVLLEVVLRHAEEQPGKGLEEADARNAALQVARPMFFATLIIITAYLPLFAFESVEKKLFTPMAYTVGYALCGALLFALCIIPGLAFATYRRPRKIFRSPILEWLGKRYDRYLRFLVKRPALILLPIIVCGGLVVLLGMSLGREFLPYLDEGSLWLQVELPGAISIEKATEMAGELRKSLLTFPEVRAAITQTGRNDDETDPWTFSHIEAAVTLKPYNQWGGDKAALIERMSKKLSIDLPGVSFGFSQPIYDNMNDLLTGAHSDLVVKIFGDDLVETRRIAQSIVDELQHVPGAADVAVDEEPPLPQLQININREAAARFGINVSDITDLIQAAVGGVAVTNFYIGERSYDIAVRAIEKYRGSPEAISNLTLPSSDGAPISLGELADLRLGAGETTIDREMSHRFMKVHLNLRGRDLSSFYAEAQKAIEEKVKFNHEANRIEWGGAFENQQRAENRLAVVVPATIGLIFLLLFFGFGEFRHAAMILIVIPLALLGGLAALYLRGMTINVSSAVGFIALFGVAVQNGVIMLSNLKRMHRDEGHTLEETVRRGAGVRLRPVLMTATVATLGLLPAALARGVGSDVQRPLATVIVGGLTTATLLTLLVLPGLYYLVERRYDRLMEQQVNRNSESGPSSPPETTA
ncbi:MAG: CusA/CzcA family heavy metal efflux RND transporter [Chthoniobacterales bacterium]